MEAKRALLIVPPFASINRPAIGMHVLQSVARAKGLQVDILYANLMCAALLGEDVHEAVCEHWFMDFWGERIMGAFAFPGQVALPPGLEALLPDAASRMPRLIAAWRDEVMAQVRAAAPGCIGVSSTFDQTNAALILLRACREALPQATLVIGGANCEDEMALGMVQHIPELDHVFSGDSEHVFAQFLANPQEFAGQKIIRCRPNESINELPANDYSSYVQQLQQCLPASPRLAGYELPYESSRGCWWGQKHHCTFCGLNGQGMGFREKTADKVFAELMQLRQRHQARRIVMTDNIMPHEYFSSLLPRLAEANSGLDIFYEQKANIDLAKAMLLKQAGISRIQPGIEGLHTGSLRLMKKGVKGKQNIALLRYARALGMHVTWNLLYGFPGEQDGWFAEVLAQLPQLAHLQPPSGMAAINIDRFSPFFNAPAQNGFANLRPHPAYAEVFPQHPHPEQMAYHFCADATTSTFASSPLLPRFEAALADWQQRWENRPSAPTLMVIELTPDQFLLLDSRYSSASSSQMINRKQAAACLVEHTHATAEVNWALQQKTAIGFDGSFLPLAVATPTIMLQFEQEYGYHMAQQRLAPEEVGEPVPVQAGSPGQDQDPVLNQTQNQAQGRTPGQAKPRVVPIRVSA